jgi:hypothetical protein
VPSFASAEQFSAIAIENFTDGEVQLAYSNLEPIIISKEDTMKVFDSWDTRGQIYIRNSTGTGGTVLLHFWRGHEYR